MFLLTRFEFRCADQAESAVMGWWQKNKIFPPRCRADSTQSPASIVGLYYYLPAR
jgi:hypothetical protein